MRIEDSEGNELTELCDWQRLHEPEKWKPGRSAFSVADFVVSQSGAERLCQRVSSVLDEPAVFLKIVPEYEVRFDRYGKGRFHDLGIRGTTTMTAIALPGVDRLFRACRSSDHPASGWTDHFRIRYLGDSIVETPDR